MHRFYMPDSPAADAASVPFSPRHSQQIARVLRLRPGETVETFDGAGAICTVQLHAVAAAHTSGTVTAVRTVVRPFPWRSVLYLALLRPQRFEWAVEKAAELGAERIVPLVTARVAHGDGTVSAARLARWQHIAIEASE